LNIFKQLILSLYSPASIATWRRQGIGKTILFVFLLTLISILPTSIQLSKGIMDGVHTTQEVIDKEAPNFSIKNGELHTDMSAPLTIDKGMFTLILDSTGEVGVKDLDKTNTTIALLKDEMAFTAGGTVEQFSYSMLELDVQKEDIVHFLDSLDSLLVVILPIFIIVIYLFSSAFKFIGISILALIGTLFNRNGKEALEYRFLWRIAAYSITLPTIFFMIMDIFKTPVPFGFMLYWFVSILLMALALKEIPQAKETLD